MKKSEIDNYVSNNKYELDLNLSVIENIDNKHFDFEDDFGTLFMVDINQFEPLSNPTYYKNGTEICILQTDIIELSKNGDTERWSEVSITLFVDEEQYKVKYTDDESTIDISNIIQLPNNADNLARMIIQLFDSSALFQCDLE